MLNNIIPVGTTVSFEHYESQLQEVLSGSRLRIAMPVVDGNVVLLPLYMQGECIFHTEEGFYKARVEIVERYKRANQYSMEVELKEGLYKVQADEMANFVEDFTDMTVEEQKKLAEKVILES